MLRCCLWTLCSNCTEPPGELRTGSSDRSRHLTIFSFWASWPVKTGLTESPGVTESPGMTGKPGAPGVVIVPGIPGVFGRTGSWIPGTGSRNRVPVIKPEPGPGKTGPCSETSGRLTEDCWTDPFIANRAFEPVSQEEDRSTGHFDSDRGDLSFDSITWSESPGVGFGPRSVASKSLAGAWTPYLPARSPECDLAGVERWVRRPFGLRPGVPCELRLPGTPVFLRTCSPPDDDRDKTEALSSSWPSAVDPDGSTRATVCSRPYLELEEFLEAESFPFFAFAFSSFDLPIFRLSLNRRRLATKDQVQSGQSWHTEQQLDLKQPEQLRQELWLS